MGGIFNFDLPGVFRGSRNTPSTFASFINPVDIDRPPSPVLTMEPECNTEETEKNEKLIHEEPAHNESKSDEPKIDELTEESKKTDQTSDQPQSISPAPSMLVITPQSSRFAEMEAFLLLQLEKCSFYAEKYKDQGTLPTLVSTFETFYTVTQRDLEMLRKAWREGGKIPSFKFDSVTVTCIPTNLAVEEKEIQLIIRTKNIPVAEGSTLYVVGEFDYPLDGKSEKISETTGRWFHSVKIEPRNILCCSEGNNSKQLDMIYSTMYKPFYDKNCEMTHYARPMSFFVEKGRSRTLKRKFKPIKLTFYEKTGFLRRDRKIGAVQVKIDIINDEATFAYLMPLMEGRKATEATADVRILVREPLVDKSFRTHEERLLILM